MKKENLLDNYVVTGSNYDEFAEELKALTSCTSVEKPQASKIELLSKIDTDDTDNLCMYLLNPEKMWGSGLLKELKPAKMKRTGFKKVDADALVEEYENDNRLMMRIDGKIYFTSMNMLSTLGIRTGISGSALHEPTLERDIFLASRMNATQEYSLIVRNVNGIKKIFAALSSKYTYVPQTILLDIVDKIQKESGLGKIDVYKWSIQHKYADIYLEFPEKANEISAKYKLDRPMVPGLYLVKSDVGEGSITIQATWRTGSSITLQQETKRKHVGKIDMDQILEEAKTKVFDQFKVLPEKLCEFMTIDITNPAWHVLPDFEEKNKAAVVDVYKKAFKKIDMVGAISKKHEKRLLEQIADSINPTIDYTMYDVVMDIMTLPQCVSGLPKAYETAFMKACGKAPYVKLVEEEETLILTA